MSVNGKPISGAITAGSYAVLDRNWNDGDKIEATFPMGLYLHRANDNPKSVAVMYGPIVLAGDLDARECGPRTKPMITAVFSKFPTLQFRH